MEKYKLGDTLWIRTHSKTNSIFSFVSQLSVLGGMEETETLNNATLDEDMIESTQKLPLTWALRKIKAERVAENRKNFVFLSSSTVTSLLRQIKGEFFSKFH